MGKYEHDSELLAIRKRMTKHIEELVVEAIDSGDDWMYGDAVRSINRYIRHEFGYNTFSVPELDDPYYGKEAFFEFVEDFRHVASPRVNNFLSHNEDWRKLKEPESV